MNAGLRTYYVNSQGDMPYIRPTSLLKARHTSKHVNFADYTFKPTANRPKQRQQHATLAESRFSA